MSPDRTGVCAWCGATFQTPSRRGPAPRYCSSAHRQAAHRDRVRSSSASRPPLAAEVTELRQRVDELERRLGDVEAPARTRTRG